MTKPMFLIVGASLAGAKAAAELRTQGFDGRVMLIGTEPERPYERPPLTKDYLRGESEREQAYVHPDGFYAQQEVELETGVTVTGIEPGASRVTLGDGRVLGYDRLLLATGAEPRRLHIPGADLDRVCYLRTLADCDLLLCLLNPYKIPHASVMRSMHVSSQKHAPVLRRLSVTKAVLAPREPSSSALQYAAMQHTFMTVLLQMEIGGKNGNVIRVTFV
jgi:hypothetical protein